MSSGETESNSIQSKGDLFGCGDSYLILNILPANLANAFNEVNNEQSWHIMNNKGSPVPRLVSTQGSIIGDLEPIYRHSSNQRPILNTWTPLVDEMRRVVIERTEIDFNHALIQLYRNGRDNISEHSDKTLDITRKTPICTLSLGAKRTLILRSKSNDAERIVQKIPLPHNSLFILGSDTNRIYKHCIKECKRANKLMSAEELFCEGQRISLTFRSISTFYDKKTCTLYGQGAPKRSNVKSDSCIVKEEIQKLSSISAVVEAQSFLLESAVIKDHSSCESNIVGILGENERRLINAFSAENKLSNFDWDLYYGEGFPLFYSDVS
jgi:alkylated DNA repair dioxygenase AlkB